MRQAEQNLHNVLFPIHFQRKKKEKKNLGIISQKEININSTTHQKTFETHSLSSI